VWPLPSLPAANLLLISPQSWQHKQQQAFQQQAVARNSMSRQKQLRHRLQLLFDAAVRSGLYACVSGGHTVVALLQYVLAW
jgi:plasmid maintenance system killer protein